MRSLIHRSLVTTAVTAALTVAAALSGPVAQSEPGIGGAAVYPGMEIRQVNTICTVGYVDPVTRVAFSAGHCEGSGPVTDNTGRAVGSLAVARDNTPDGAIVTTEQTITDYEAIVLAPGVEANNVLPGGRQLVVQSGRLPVAGEPICHFGVVTGESCGTVDRVFNGWFTMTNGVVSQKGDSGGPVYVLDGDRAILVGLFNCTWGAFPAAVSWEDTGRQLRAEASLASTAAAAVSNAAAAVPHP